MLAAVDRQGRAGDEIGIVGDQEQHAARDILGMAEPPDGDAAMIFSSTAGGTARTISVST